MNLNTAIPMGYRYRIVCRWSWRLGEWKIVGTLDKLSGRRL